MSGGKPRVDPAHVPYVYRRLAEIGFWFIDVPRTSSTSIKAALAARYGKLFGKRGVRQGVTRGLIADHTPITALHDALGASLFARVRTVTVVRDPWERTLSMYLYRKQLRGEDLPDFDEYVGRLAEAVEADPPGEGAPAWRADLDPLFRYHGYRWSACRYLCDAEGAFLVDAIVRFENRDRELALVAQRWGVPALAPTARRTGATSRAGYEHAYTAGARDALARAYRDDVERLEYRFGGSAPSAAP